MTGGWAATNTLRDLLWSGPALGDDNTCLWCGGRYSLGHREDCEAAAALSLVETALAAAEKAIAAEADGFPAMATLFRQELAAALRAVREGK